MQVKIKHLLIESEKDVFVSIKAISTSTETTDAKFA